MGSKRKLINGSDDDATDVEDNREENEAQQNLERSIKEIYQEEDDPQQRGLAKKAELISKLEEARQEEASRKRMARRIAWRTEVRKGLERSAEFKGIMESLPLEDVEADKKPMMSRMSIKCREAFKSERADFLFPQVLSTLLKLQWSRGPDPKLLVCRRVCKSAKESMDAILSCEDLLHRMRTQRSDFYIPTCYDNSLGISKFPGLYEATIFTKEFSQALMNPFFSRSIEIVSPPNGASLSTPSPPELWKGIQGILRRWGKELWSALLIFREDMPPELIYDRLGSYLRLMPNLRFLGVRFVIETEVDNFVNFNEHTVKNPLPDLPHLSRLTVESSNPSPLTHAILTKFGSAVERVGLEYLLDFDAIPVTDTVSNYPPPAIWEGNFSALREMHICYRFIGSVADVQNVIKNFSNWRLPLRRLGLELHNRGIEGERYGPLVALNNNVFTSKRLFLEMPQLEELTLILHYRFNLRTFDFLLPCKALKALIVHNIRVERDAEPRINQQGALEEDKGIFQFTTDPADKDLIYRSPIWKLLPELKRIVLKTVSLKRLGKFQKATDEQYMSVGRPKTYKYTREEYLQCHRERENGGASVESTFI